jgi:hypothetical protein
MAEQAVIVGDVYQLNGVARLRICLSYGGVPVTGQHPTVTLVRDSDGHALDFVLGSFEPVTPSTLGNSNFKATMLELGVGNYFFDFSPTDYGATKEDVYTVIYRNETPPYLVTVQEEFLFADHFSLEKSGIVPRPLNVCLNEQFTIKYQSLSGLIDVLISIYNKYNTLLISDANMTEIGHTGIYEFPYIYTLDGEYLIIVREASRGARDAILMRGGGDSCRLKKIEKLLSDFMLNPPSAKPCGTC